MAVPILFNAILVNYQTTNATIAVGQNGQSSWGVNQKLNQGRGTFVGLAWILGELNLVVDPDFIDSPIVDNDLSLAGELQTL